MSASLIPMFRCCRTLGDSPTGLIVEESLAVEDRDNFTDVIGLNCGDEEGRDRIQECPVGCNYECSRMPSICPAGEHRPLFA